MEILGPVIQTNSNLDRGLKQSFHPQVFLEVSCFKELHDFPLCSINLLHSIHNEQSLCTTIGQNESDLERGSVKHQTPFKKPALTVCL